MCRKRYSGKASRGVTREQRTPEEQERLNRELIELLNEVRVAMPGVQVLFGFLLAVPFQQRFAEATSFQRDVYFATLLCVGAGVRALHRADGVSPHDVPAGREAAPRRGGDAVRDRRAGRRSALAMTARSCSSPTCSSASDRRDHHASPRPLCLGCGSGSADAPRCGDRQRRMAPPTAILDVDGTLVDTNYHHALAWYRASAPARRTGADLADPPSHRHGRRQDRRGARRRGGRARARRRRSAPPRARLYGAADRRSRADARARAS